jgi:predicted aldo/keto reductase-like oxidoreductase
MMVSRIGFGGIPIQRANEDTAVAVVRRCLDLGINFIDTANAYTNSEERIGKAISGKRHSAILATKSTARTRERMEKHLQQSLKRLGVEQIDLYQFHQVGDLKALDSLLDRNGPMAALEEARGAGHIKHIGITSHSMEVAKEAVKSDRFTTIQFPFNFIECEAADELIPLTRTHDVGFIGMKPLAGGALDNVTIAIKYILQFPDVVPIPGVQETREIEEIVGVFNGPGQMTGEEQQEIERLRHELGSRFCRRCDYCQPCPEGIYVSMALTASNYLKRAPAEWFFSGLFAGILEKAAGCNECGECEERCPYQLPIREMISEQVEWFRQMQDRMKSEPTGGRDQNS